MDLCNNVRCETITVAKGCPMSVFHVPCVSATSPTRATVALEHLDVDVASVEIAGRCHRRVLRSTETCTSAVGTVKAKRTLYRCGRGRAVVPMELRAGIVEGYWTLLAARQTSRVVAEMTPSEGEGLLRELGNMAPSKSSLDRLPKVLSARWEAHRAAFEATLREAAFGHRLKSGDSSLHLRAAPSRSTRCSGSRCPTKRTSRWRDTQRRPRS